MWECLTQSLVELVELGIPLPDLDGASLRPISLPLPCSNSGWNTDVKSLDVTMPDNIRPRAGTAAGHDDVGVNADFPCPETSTSFALLLPDCVVLQYNGRGSYLARHGSIAYV